MATTIDAIQIEIQSSSTSAAKGIRDFSAALGELKKNGISSSAVSKLNDLSSALKGFADASNATRSIGKLVGSLSKLKAVGSVASISNSIAKLSTGLKALDTVDVEHVAPQIEKIAAAVAPLSTIKAGGIGTMVNALAKIGKVTEALDDDKIAAFADRIKQLTAAVEPLSTKMTTVQAGLKGINSTAKSAGSAVKQMGEDVNASTLNLASMVTAIQGAIQAISAAIQKFKEFISQAIEWDGIAARFGRGFGSQAQETYDWIQRLNEEMAINVQQFMQYSSVYATMLTGFGVATEDATKMALGYTELTYDIWAGYNDIYKSFGEAAEAVKSAIAGEVEPIRRAGFTIVEATLEQTAANHGLEISIANATEAQKSYLRYLTLVDQAHAQNLVGTYAKELNTAEGLMRTFSQQLKSLAQAFGSLFLPVLVKIMPYLQAFVELLFDAVQWLASLFGIEIMGVDWSGYNAGVGDAVENTGELEDAISGAGAAAKELKNATIGIDELNVISPPSASSGGGASGSGSTGFEDLDVESLWDESIFSEIGSQVDKIKEKLEGWMPVIGAIAGAFGALGLAALILSIGESMEELSKMDGMLGTLKKTLAGLAILTIEAVLVFMLADEYLESGNLMALVGEALATAAGGYLMYKGFGTKGLVMSLAVSMLAQLAAITMNLADGGVEIDDPELWVQTAMTALTGASGGMFAFKGIKSIGAGKGAAIGMAASLSLSLAAINIGDIASDGELGVDNVISGILSVVGGAATGAMIGGLWGAIIGAAVMLVVNVVGAIVGAVNANAEEELQESLSERFGEIELSTSEIKLIIDKVTPEWKEGVEIAAKLYVDLEVSENVIESQINTLNGYNWQVSVGLGLNEEQQGKYKSAIDAFVSEAQQYVIDKGYALEVGLKATGASEFVIDTSTLVSLAASEEMTRLGNQLRETVNAAFEDGLLDIDELEAIKTIQQDMFAIQQALSSGAIEAEISMIKLKWSGVDLTDESFKNMMSEWRDTINDKIRPELEATVEGNLNTLHGNVAFAELALKEDPNNPEKQQLLRDAETALQEYLDSNPLENLTAEVILESLDFGLNTIEELYAGAIQEAEEAGYTDFSVQLPLGIEFRPGIVFDDGNGDIYGNIEILAQDMYDAMNINISNISKSTRDQMLDLFESLKPTAEDLDEIAAANREAGQTVPAEVRAGLNDYNQIAAIAGDVDAINYVIGQGFSTDPVFLNTLATVEKAGKSVPEEIRAGLLNNIDYVKDAASGMVIGIKDATTGEVINMTPFLQENLKELGVNLGDSLGGRYQYVYDETSGMLKGIVDSTTDEMVWISDELGEAGKTVGKDLSDGLKEGVEVKQPGLLERFKTWGKDILGTIRDKFDTHSPSRETKAIGEDLSDGLVAGIEGKETSVWGSLSSWASGIIDKVKDFFGIASPSKEFKKLGGYLSDGLSEGMDDENTLTAPLKEMWNNAKDWWNKKRSDLTYTPSIGSIYDKVKTRWDSARTWWNSKKTKMKEYTPSIGSIYDKVSARWKNAKDWWNKKKGTMSYTPSIGSLTDKLKSSWNSAKKWWKNNVKLDTKLNIKVPTVKVKWETASAFGKSFKYPKGFDLKFAAAGGIFDAGSLIWAGERGAEVVANAGGGKTGVMNVGQMQEAVYEGVYAAVVAAMRASGGSGSQDVNVYLDGRKIAASVERQQKERGASILGTQVYSYG